MNPVRRMVFGIASLLVILAVGCAAPGPGGSSSPTPAGAPVDPGSSLIAGAGTPGTPDLRTVDRQAPALPSDVPVGTAVGQVAPDFAIAYADGRPLTASGLRVQQKPYILYFFATW